MARRILIIRTKKSRETSVSNRLHSSGTHNCGVKRRGTQRRIYLFYFPGKRLSSFIYRAVIARFRVKRPFRWIRLRRGSCRRTFSIYLPYCWTHCCTTDCNAKSRQRWVYLRRIKLGFVIRP